jgi:uroporphyrinogen-III synthase
VIAPEGRHDSETLLAHEELRSVEGLEVLIFRGMGGRELLRDTLSSRGARVTYAECYRRVRPASESAPLVDAWARGAIQAVSVLSAETLENFVEMVGEEAAPYLAATALIVPHPAVAAHPLARRFRRVLVTGAEPEAMARALATLRVNP